jgi:uncharacterized protein YjiS (DUF1127 family)
LRQRHRFAGRIQLEKKMTTIYPTATQSFASGLPGGFARAVGILADRLAAYLARREAIKVLHGMDDRGLRDIGLARCQIEAAVYRGMDWELARLQ